MIRANRFARIALRIARATKFVKIGDFMKFKGLLLEFLENRCSLENQTPSEKSPDEWTFLSVAFYNGPN